MSKFSLLIVAVLVAVCSAFAPTTSKLTNTAVDTRTKTTFSPTDPFDFQLGFLGADSDTYPEEDYPDSETYWNAEYPPSKVLGPIMSKMPSGMLGALSIMFLSALVISISGSAALQTEPGAFENGSWVKWYYVLGSFGGPLAWGTHVAAWIQRKNGM
mmetsp:Transcript_52395/g.59334  ORF Transcript_52395/g.59334 Transcript_52395/m.59334 type:complete len:157 (-) Transcript_52395:333-803(-)